jgi:peptide/nickel transport system substrate-binding protein
MKLLNRPKISIRDFIWEYPEKLHSLYRKTRPISSIVVSLIVGVSLFLILTNPENLEILALESRSEWSEGAIGSVESLNPLYISQNPIDRDLYALIYEKFINIDHDGNPTPGIANSWDITNDGKTYTFTLGEKHRWHDGEVLDAYDVGYTFEKAAELDKTGGFNTIATALNDIDINVVDSKTITFTLPERSSTFFESISVYIVPKHKYELVDDNFSYEYGLEVPPIGSGPYKIQRRDKSVIILDAVNSEIYSPSIKLIKYYLFNDLDELEVAFRNNILDGVGNITLDKQGFINEFTSYDVHQTILEQRKKGIFINTINERLESPELRSALALATDKESLISKAKVDGQVVFSPLPSNSWAFNSDANYYQFDTEKSKAVFEELGYTLDSEGIYIKEDGTKAEFTLTYLENDTNTLLVESLSELWRENGILLNLEGVEYNSLVNEILATKDFELLLFEIETTLDPDQYNLWHSAKANYPDLNITSYDYTRVDIILERARVNADQDDRLVDYQLFQKYLSQDVPVIFLYEPMFNYVVRDDIEGPSLEGINFPHERFEGIESWKL